MKKIITIIVVLILLSVSMAAVSYWTGVNKPHNVNGETVAFAVEPGSSVEKIILDLAASDLIVSPFFLKTHVWFSGLGSDLKAGTFAISPAMSGKEIIAILVAGDGLERERDVKIIEGWKISDIESYIEKNSILEHNDYREKAEQKIGDWVFAFDKPAFLHAAPDDRDLEGYLFPDTYKIFTDASSDDLIEKQLDNFAKKVDKAIMDEINRQGKTLHEILTMASIIEKEVSLEKDRAIVSGILNKRIRVGMRLEVDSTINYLTGKNDPAAQLRDLEIDSPYNTYRYYGLPPGPICNPSLSAIRAAVYPEESAYFFYLNRQDTKETIFGIDYNEHLRNKAKYLK